MQKPDRIPPEVESSQVVFFDEQKIIVLERELQTYKERCSTLCANAQANQETFNRLQEFGGLLAKQPTISRLNQLVQWFADSYQPSRVCLIARTYRVNKIFSSHIRYRPQLDFWDDSLKAIFDIEEICFAPLTNEHSQKLLDSPYYESAGIIPFRVNEKYLNRHEGRKQRQIKVWLIFADEGERFLPDSSQSLDFLKAMQKTFNQILQ